VEDVETEYFSSSPYSILCAKSFSYSLLDRLDNLFLGDRDGMQNALPSYRGSLSVEPLEPLLLLPWSVSLPPLR
jgi:hypothetical protein